MTVLALERNARNVKPAFAHITNRYGSLRATASLHSAEGGRTGDGELAGGRIAGDVDGLWAGRIVARDRNRGGLCSKTARLKRIGTSRELPAPIVTG